MRRIKKTPALILLCFALIGPSCRQASQKEEPLISFVRPLNGTDGRGFITPVAVAPFGMIQLGPDTRRSASGYIYSDSSIIGFSHTHKSGGGCNDFQDILLQPFTGKAHFEQGSDGDPSSGYRSRFSHDREEATVGMYSVTLEDYDIEVDLTATRRCGLHRYRYPEGKEPGLVLDLEHGSDYACTIIKEDNYDTVKASSLTLLSDTQLEGSRISSGMTEEMHVYFAMEFNRPFHAVKVRDSGRIDTLNKEFRGTDIKAIFRFEDSDEPLLVRVGISNVSTGGAWGNLQSEIRDWDFDGIVARNRSAWETQLQKFRTEGGTKDQRIIFYTGLYHVFTYPMLYSDADGRFRGPDHRVHRASGYDNYSGVVGVWDTFRSAVPLLHFTNPEVSSDYINTMLDHFDICGLLPIWTLWGNEFFGMLGYHCLPVIADAYSKGIGGFDPERALEAMQATAEKDTFGYWMRRWIGLENYKTYGYVPADLEYTSVSKTLEYAYDDWCLSQMAGLLDRDEAARKYIERSGAYRHVYDPSSGFMRGRLTDGSWRTPFHPRRSEHWVDDYAEGTAWQWTFFVPHDVTGLAQLMGGRERFIQKLDSLFLVTAEVEGNRPSTDIVGGIGQYAHGNEVVHQVIYMYNLVDEPWKTQEKAREIMERYYRNSPDAYTGNEDTGQMASWFVWNAIGLFPYTHGDGRYAISSPLFDRVEIRMGDGPDAPMLLILAENNRRENKYIQELYLNGKPYRQTMIQHKDLINAELRFVMGPEPADWFCE